LSLVGGKAKLLRGFLPGLTYRLDFDFFDDSGNRLGLDAPTANVYTPEKQAFLSSQSLTAVTTGKYGFNFFLPAGATVGNWFALGTGYTTGVTTFSDAVPFEVVDITVEPYWVSLGDLRGYLQVDDDDHTRDSLYKEILRAAIQLVEAYTHRTFGLRTFEELIEIKNTDRVKLKRYPIQAITGATPTIQISPYSQTSLVQQSITGSIVNFNFRLDKENGIMKLTDSSGFEMYYNGMILALTYIAGFPSTPEPIRAAVLALASKLVNLATSEGISSIRLSDISFAIDNKLFEGHIGDLLKDYVDRQI
jgi:hypothetical protein